MPSLLYNIPGFPDSKNLDSRYGKERVCYRNDVAAQMARVDDLVEKAGIKPGDQFEVFYKPRDKKAPEWVKVPGVFVEVDNGRLHCKLEPYEFGFGAYLGNLKLILDIRKQSAE